MKYTIYNAPALPITESGAVLLPGSEAATIKGAPVPAASAN